MTSPPALTAAWTTAVAAEQQAVFGYGLLGSRLTGADAIALARRCQQAHQDLIDSTAVAFARAGVPAPAPAPDYPGLYPVSDQPSAQRLAIELEQDAATAWRFAYASAAEGAPNAAANALRSAAQSALTASAVRATQWRLLTDASSPTVAFPGL